MVFWDRWQAGAQDMRGAEQLSTAGAKGRTAAYIAGGNIVSLMLVDAKKDLSPLTPAALYEVAAAKYVKIDIGYFRQLVRTGIIRARTHPGRTRWIYLKEDLDGYLRGLPTVDAGRGKMRAGEVPSKPPVLKEVKSGS